MAVSRHFRVWLRRSPTNTERTERTEHFSFAQCYCWPEISNFEPPNCPCSVAKAVYPKNSSMSEAYRIFGNIPISYGEGLLAPRPTHKFDDHPLSLVRDWTNHRKIIS
jgi:hypothetical protein